MRRLTILIFLCCCVGPAQAALLFYDGFDYTAGEKMAPTNDTSGSPNPGQHNVDYNVDWRYGGAGGATEEAPGVASGSLSVPGLKPSVGNSVGYDLTMSAVARVDLPGGPIADGTVYWSGMLRVTDVPNLDPTTTGGGGGIFVAALNNLTEATGLPTLFAGHLAITKSTTDSSQYFIGTGVNNNSRVFALGSPQNDGDTVFVVVSYSRNSGTNDDTVSLWLNPDSSTFAAGTAPAPLISGGLTTGNELSSISSFVVRNVRDTSGADPTIVFDELRIGTTWASVTPIPEPASYSLLLIAAFLMCGRGRFRE